MSDPICLNCGKSLLECQGFCPKKGMREKIAEIIYLPSEEESGLRLVDYADKILVNTSLMLADQILSLTHDGWEMVEECDRCDNGTIGSYAVPWDEIGHEAQCPDCNGTGKLTRTATLRDIVENKNVRRV